MAHDEAGTENPEIQEMILEWIIPLGMPAILADHMITHYDATAKHFVLSLFEAKKPIMITQADLEAARKAETVPAHCVGRFIIPFERMGKFATAFADTMNKADLIRAKLKEHGNQD